MTSAPTVSVITISFNDLDGLQRTVKSVRAQRYRGRIEHIVIDGGSGDDVVAYLSGCEPGFAYWQSEPDGGRYDAMNQGIAHASGDLLWFLHSADRFSGPDVVAQAVEALSGKGPVSELWGFGMDRLVGLDRVRGPIPFSLRKFLAGKQVVPHQASFFGSSLVAKIGGYDLDFGIAADQEFILRPRWYASRSRFGVCCASSTPRASARTGNQARSSVICAAWATFIAATRSGEGEYHMPTYAAGSSTPTTVDSGKTSSRECRNRLTRRRVNRCPGRRCHRPAAFDRCGGR